jgi:hypothetical protein
VDVKVGKAHICCGPVGVHVVRPGARDLKVVHWFCVPIIRTPFTLASLVWWPGCQMANAKKRLNRLQRLACLVITGAMRTTPAGSMEALTGLPPLLELVIQGEARSAAHRLLESGMVLRSPQTRT